MLHGIVPGVSQDCPGTVPAFSSWYFLGTLFMCLLVLPQEQGNTWTFLTPTNFSDNPEEFVCLLVFCYWEAFIVWCDLIVARTHLVRKQKNQEPKRTRKTQKSHEKHQRIFWIIRGGYWSLPSKTRALRQITPESSSENVRLNLCHTASLWYLFCLKWSHRMTSWACKTRALGDVMLASQVCGSKSERVFDAGCPIKTFGEVLQGGYEGESLVGGVTQVCLCEVFPNSRVTFGGGTARAVPVFCSGGFSGEFFFSFLCFSSVYQYKLDWLHIVDKGVGLFFLGGVFKQLARLRAYGRNESERVIALWGGRFRFRFLFWNKQFRRFRFLFRFQEQAVPMVPVASSSSVPEPHSYFQTFSWPPTCQAHKRFQGHRLA